MTETDAETARCPECGIPLTMHHDPGCSQPCGRCAAARPPAGKFRVTIRVERPDGQFVTSSRLIPDDLIAPGPDTSVMQDWAVGEVGSAFVSAYHHAAGLPD